MKKIEWSEKLSTGIPEIDEQHKQLCNLLNDLTVALEEGWADAAMQDVLLALISYTQTHFYDEELLMQRYNFPGYDSHREQHRKLTAQVQALNERYKHTKAAQGRETARFLRRWLLEHILRSDQEYAAFIRAAEA